MANSRGSNDKANTKSCCLDKLVGDISKTSAVKQVALGTATGWITGILAIKAGKVAAFAAGTSIVLLQVANHAGYIKVNWDRINKQLEKVSDKVEEKATGSGPNWMDKVERYVDKKMDKAEEKLTQNERKAKRWYSGFVGDDKSYKLEDIHIFLVSFAGGLALGIATS